MVSAPVCPVNSSPCADVSSRTAFGAIGVSFVVMHPASASSAAVPTIIFNIFFSPSNGGENMPREPVAQSPLKSIPLLCSPSMMGHAQHHATANPELHRCRELL